MRNRRRKKRNGGKEARTKEKIIGNDKKSSGVKGREQEGIKNGGKRRISK